MCEDDGEDDAGKTAAVVVAHQKDDQEETVGGEEVEADDEHGSNQGQVGSCLLAPWIEISTQRNRSFNSMLKSIKHYPSQDTGICESFDHVDKAFFPAYNSCRPIINSSKTTGSGIVGTYC